MSSDNLDIYHTPVRCGVALAWVNSYSAVVVKSPGATLLFDPVSMDVPEGVSLDLIAVSHGHSDHWDPKLVARLQGLTRAPVVASPYLTSRLTAHESVRNTGQAPASGRANNPTSFLSERGARGDCLHWPEVPRPEAPRAETPGTEDPAYPVSHEVIDHQHSGRVRPVSPGDELKVGDLTVTALRCDHAAVEPLAFQVRTEDGVIVYLPGDTTPFPEMEHLPHLPAIPLPTSEGNRERVDVLVWMGTALNDGAEIARLVQPRQFLTYAIGPPAAGERAHSILTGLTPEAPFQVLARNQVFSYPSKAKTH